MKLRAAVIDYGVGNVGSVCQALLRAGARPQITRAPEDIAHADFLVLPGVGEFSTAMRSLESSGLAAPLRQAILDDEKPVLGICLGMQLFAASSEESPGIAGLGLLPGSVTRLPSEGGPVPNTGWMEVATSNGSGLDGCYYFSHSFFYDSPPDQVIATTMGARNFAACLRWKNIVGCQFHPEKSQTCGEHFLAWFLNFVRSKQHLF
jgi:glutamine amidotransferase